MSLYKFLSFCTIPELEDNNQKTVSPLGELSTKGRTYTEYPASYKTTDSITTLVTFTGTKDDAYSLMPVGVQEQLLGLTDWIFTKGKNGTFTNDKASAYNLITANFNGKFTFLSMGEMTTEGSVWLPSHIEGNYFIDEDNTVNFKIWFANEMFLAEYPYCDIKVTLPLPDESIDILAVGNYQQIAAALLEETQDKVERRVLETTGSIPYTDRIPYPIAIYDQLNSDRNTVVYFIVTTNGNTADSSDQIIDAIQKKLLSVSKKSEAVWTPRAPDLFNPMQFTCVPYWDRLGVENKTVGGSLYSPITDYETAFSNITRYLKGVNSDVLIKSTQFYASFYKSLNVGFVGSANNRDSKVKLTAIYTDLSLIPPDDSQAQWMSDATLTFIQQIDNLLSAAEVITPDGVVPTGVKRLTRDGILYATMKIGQVNYIAVSRYQFIQDGLING